MSRAAEGSDLDRECVRRLRPIKFGVHSQTDRIVTSIGTALARGEVPSTKQQLALYSICWRYREQLADNAFTARVLIVERLLIETTDVADLMADRARVRAWHAGTPLAQRDIFA